MADVARGLDDNAFNHEALLFLAMALGTGAPALLLAPGNGTDP
jgi:thiol:disulfide interchange protein